MDDTISFNEARARKNENSKLWSPLDCLLKAIIRDIENGQINPDQLLIIYREEVKDSEYPYLINTYQAGVDRNEHLSLLELHKWFFMKDWST